MPLSPCPVYFPSLPVDGPTDGPTVAGYWELAYAIQADFGPAVGLAFGSVAPSGLADPYPTWDAMRRAANLARAGFGPFLVSDTCHGHPIWSDGENWVFRAHHDALHELSGHEAFTFAGETMVSRATVARLGLRPRAAATLVAEIVGQAQHFRDHGTFPRGADGLQTVWALEDSTVDAVARWLGI